MKRDKVVASNRSLTKKSNLKKVPKIAFLTQLCPLTRHLEKVTFVVIIIIIYP